MNISPDAPISIYRDSDSVSLWSQNSRKMALAPRIKITDTIVYHHIVKYGYCCPIDPLILWVEIG